MKPKRSMLLPEKLDSCVCSATCHPAQMIVLKHHDLCQPVHIATEREKRVYWRVFVCVCGCVTCAAIWRSSKDTDNIKMIIACTTSDFLFALWPHAFSSDSIKSPLATTRYAAQEGCAVAKRVPRGGTFQASLYTRKCYFRENKSQKKKPWSPDF
jgi:hypothetical protein